MCRVSQSSVHLYIYVFIDTLNHGVLSRMIFSHLKLMALNSTSIKGAMCYKLLHSIITVALLNHNHNHDVSSEIKERCQGNILALPAAMKSYSPLKVLLKVCFCFGLSPFSEYLGWPDINKSTHKHSLLQLWKQTNISKITNLGSTEIVCDSTRNKKLRPLPEEAQRPELCENTG